MYTKLDSHKVIQYQQILSKRIEERFPDSGLFKVSKEVLMVSEKAKASSIKIGEPNVLLRFFVGFVIFILAIGIIEVFLSFNFQIKSLGFSEFVQMLEAGLNNVVLIVAGVIFLTTIENKIQRNRVTKLMNELRALAHIIDMHQLTKDPEGILNKSHRTPSQPQEDMTAFELNRYYDFCSEMLSIISKIAALYVQRYGDPVVAQKGNEIEDLITGLCRKIWQKTILLQSYKN